MPVLPVRVYADTTVFGGAFDDEFESDSLAFFEQARSGRIRLATSALVRAELDGAPKRVQDLFEELEPLMEVLPVTREAVRLQSAYLRACVVGEASMNDALHVALATVARCAILVSWNFKHLVQYRRIRGYNAVIPPVATGILPPPGGPDPAIVMEGPRFEYNPRRESVNTAIVAIGEAS